ncbi:uncharacterized protein [Onthophagus taurus]|uniref:uncharacterized protein isoform X2 n=1 Tax=Onthophagus taurus TaxID=166361 RepID=UPI0039BDE98A
MNSVESDELYDSIENLNDFSPTSTTNVDISNYVPLYDGEISIEKFKPRTKRFQSKIPIKCDSKLSTTTAKRSTKGVSKTNIDLTDYRVEKNSYVSIFHAKNAKFKKPPELNDTQRSQIGDFTQRTDISEVSTYFSDARSSCSDSTSFYFDMIKRMENGEEIVETESKKHDIETKTSCTLKTLNENYFNLKSVSEYSFAGSAKTGKSKNTINSSNLVVPRLGGLGPDLNE